MQQITLDLVPSGVRENAYASQYDIGRTIRFNLKNGGATYTLTGAETVTMRVRKPDGTERTESITNTSSTYVDWTTINGTCDLDGLYDCELVVMNGSVKIGSANFTLNAEVDPYSGKVVIKMATGNPAHFETDLGGAVIDCKCNLPYNADGYTSATVINSSTTPVKNQTPYLTRTPTNIGNRCLEMLVGGTVAFNQLVPTAKITITTVVASDISSNTWGARITGIDTSIINHVVYGIDNFSDNKCRVGWGNNAGSFVFGGYVDTLSNRKEGVYKPDSSTIGNGDIYIRYLAGLEAGTYTNTIQLFDLTAMFGSTIADYIYTLEQGTAGAGVAWFRNYFTADYYPYTANTLMSVKTSAKKIYDANNTLIETYDLSGSRKVWRRYIHLDLGSLAWFKGGSYNNIFYATPTGANELKRPTNDNTIGDILSEDYITIAYNSLNVNDNTTKGISIRAADVVPTIRIKDPNYQGGTADDFKTAMSGKYVDVAILTPYYETVTNPELRGIPKLDADNNLYYDGDTCNDFTNPQTVVSGGKEEFVDGRSVEIPVGHDTIYAKKTDYRYW